MKNLNMKQRFVALALAGGMILPAGCAKVEDTSSIEEVSSSSISSSEEEISSSSVSSSEEVSSMESSSSEPEIVEAPTVPGVVDAKYIDIIDGVEQEVDYRYHMYTDTISGFRYYTEDLPLFTDDNEVLFNNYQSDKLIAIVDSGNNTVRFALKETALFGEDVRTTFIDIFGGDFFDSIKIGAVSPVFYRASEEEVFPYREVEFSVAGKLYVDPLMESEYFKNIEIQPNTFFDREGLEKICEMNGLSLYHDEYLEEEYSDWLEKCEGELVYQMIKK